MHADIDVHDFADREYSGVYLVGYTFEKTIYKSQLYRAGEFINTS